MPIHLLHAQALSKDDQSALTQGQRVAVETGQRQWPTTGHGRGFDASVIGDLCVGLEQRCQDQSGWGTGGWPCGWSL